MLAAHAANSSADSDSATTVGSANPSQSLVHGYGDKGYAYAGNTDCTLLRTDLHVHYTQINVMQTQAVEVRRLLLF